MVHHLPHEIDICHEDGGIPLLENETQTLEAELKLFVLGCAHVFCELLHGLGCFGLILDMLNGGDEKL